MLCWLSLDASSSTFACPWLSSSFSSWHLYAHDVLFQIHISSQVKFLSQFPFCTMHCQSFLTIKFKTMPGTSFIFEDYPYPFECTLSIVRFFYFQDAYYSLPSVIHSHPFWEIKQQYIYMDLDTIFPSCICRCPYSFCWIPNTAYLSSSCRP